MLTAKTTVYKHTKGKTLYLSIPSKMAQDSAFTIKDGDTVILEFDSKKNQLVIFPIAKTKAKIA